MRIQLIKSRPRLFGAGYDILNNHKVVGTAEIPNGYQNYKIWIEYQKESKILLKFDFEKSLKLICNSQIRENYNVFEENSLVGEIYFDRCGQSHVTNRRCNLQINGTVYEGFLVGLGENGLKIPVFTQEKQIGLIERACVVVDGKSAYEITATEEYIRVLVIMALYIDAAGFNTWGRISKGRVKTILTSKSPEILAKYNPRFWDCP